MKLRSLYILSIVGLLLVIVVQIGGMMYAYDNTKKEAERALNECFVWLLSKRWTTRLIIYRFLT